MPSKTFRFKSSTNGGEHVTGDSGCPSCSIGSRQMICPECVLGLLHVEHEWYGNDGDRKKVRYRCDQCMKYFNGALVT